MKKIVLILLSILSATFSKGYEKMKTINTDKILYSMPTISGDDISYIMPTHKSFIDAPQFHEDEWCQVQFFHKNQLEKIKKLLIKYKKFEIKHRTKYGWSDIYVRKINSDNLHLSLEELSKILLSKVTPSPILTTSSKPLGQVKNGFSIRVEKGVLLYGIQENDSIKSLGTILESDSYKISLTKIFTKLNKEKSLILVDWRNQNILFSTDENGKINIWHP